MIGVADIGIGNLRSLTNAIEELGFDLRVFERAPVPDGVERVVLPGVGGFIPAAENLEARGLAGSIRDFAARGRPLLGICLGMQLLADTGTEGGECRGLGLVPGRVERIAGARAVRVPHVGWNVLSPVRDHPLLAGVKAHRDVYFVHSYRFVPAQEDDVVANTEHGAVFPAIVARGNVVGFQFHPEKSQATGLRLLENFLTWDGAC